MHLTPGTMNNIGSIPLQSNIEGYIGYKIGTTTSIRVPTHTGVYTPSPYPTPSTLFY